VVLLREARERSDLTLVEECRGGDATAFDELVRRYKDCVYNVVYRFVGNHEDALDVCQEVFMRAYRGVAGFRGSAKVYTWLYCIAANVARNRLRDGGRKGRDKGVSLDALEAAGAPAASQSPHPQCETPRAAAERHELDEMLQRCLNELPDHYRMAFVLRTFDDLSYEEIAEALGCPTGTVKSRISQARKMLRDRLEELAVL
jgi:RNA polymerase sigma-70 factor (ECF subfamily)